MLDRVVFDTISADHAFRVQQTTGSELAAGLEIAMDKVNANIVRIRTGAPSGSPGDVGLDEHLGKLLTGSFDISGFRQWFASALWEIESEADEDTVEFASLVENRIAEYARGHVPDQVLLDTLRADVAARSTLT